MEFSEENIAALFGHEAAEDEDIERLKGYYFKGTVYGQIANDLSIRILVGHKGIGKSALFRVAIAEEAQQGKLSLLIKPNDIVGIGNEQSNFLNLIREWKVGIVEIIARKALSSLNLVSETEGLAVKLASFGGRIVDFLQATLQASKLANLLPAQQMLIDNFLKNKRIYVYLDDLDRGWEGSLSDIKKISALLNAVRDIAAEMKGVSFRISLRSDVYYLVRTSDESTDKIEGSVIWYSWTNHEILALLVKRVEQFFENPVSAEELLSIEQPLLANRLDRIMSHTFNGRGNWSNIPTYRMLMSLVRKRPRDLVKLCTLAARNANVHSETVISTQNFTNIFEEYSQGRLQDTINEYRSELPDIERLLFGMKPSREERRASQNYTYTTQSLLSKINNIQQSGVFKFNKKRISQSDMTGVLPASPKDLSGFLYKINFITARKERGDFIERRYFEESRYLSNNFVDFGFDWEIHPAYRWALQPDNVASIFNSLKLSHD